MKYILTLFIFAITLLPALADDTMDRLQQGALACAEAFRAGNYQVILKYTHPRVIEAMGGKNAALDQIKNSLSGQKADGFAFLSAKIGVPEPIRKAGSWNISRIPEHIVSQVPGGYLVSDSMLLGISEDDGKDWVYIDLGPVSKSDLDELFPELKDKVELPVKKKPEFRKDLPS